MPTFVYKAKHGPGRTIDGELRAESRAAAVAAIDAMGYSPISVHEKPAGSACRRIGMGWRRITQRDVTVFTRQLASLIRSGVPILRALSTVVEQTENGRFQRVVESLEISIRDGNMLSDAMAAHPSLFPELYVNMVRSGESAGILDTILTRLSEAREKEEDLRRKIQAALAYPILVLCVGVATVFALFAFFLPRVTVLFEDFRALPLPTRVLIGISDFFSNHWYWVLLAVFLVIAVFRRLASLGKGRTFIDGIYLHMPLVRRFVLEADIARFARTLSLLVQAGIPVDKALSLSSNNLGNAVLREELEGVRRGTVTQGAPLSDGLKKSRHIPVFVANMTAVGEEAGRLDESLAEIASFYEKELDQHSRLAASLLEPVLILTVGVVVGFIVVSMLLPIFEIGTAI